MKKRGFFCRYCLWILGNSETLLKSGSVWKNLVLDSKNRGFFHNAFDDKNMAQAITSALVELNQFRLLFNPNSLAFKNAKWKVHFIQFFTFKFVDYFACDMRNTKGMFCEAIGLFL